MKNRSATVTVAMQPDKDTLAKIEKFVKARGAAKIVYETDENIIGGIIIQIGDTVYDGSLRGRLDKIKENL